MDKIPAATHSPYWRLLRDVLVFQGKLALDGLRDLLLSPLSLVAAVAGVIVSPADPHRFLRHLLLFGRKSDHFINLFELPDSDPALAAGDVAPSADGSAPKATTTSSSIYIKQLEDLLMTEYRKGGIVKDVKEGTDEVLRKLAASIKSSSDKNGY